MRTHKAQKTVSLKKQIGIDIYWETVGQNEIWPLFDTLFEETCRVNLDSLTRIRKS